MRRIKHGSVLVAPDDLSFAEETEIKMSSQLDHPDGSPGLDDLTPEEASRIIHSHRKVRYGESALVDAKTSLPPCPPP